MSFLAERGEKNLTSLKKGFCCPKYPLFTVGLRGGMRALSLRDCAEKGGKQKKEPAGVFQQALEDFRRCF